MPTGAKMIPYLRIGNVKNHTLSRGTYLYSPYMGVPLPSGGGTHTTKLDYRHIGLSGSCVLTYFPRAKWTSTIQRFSALGIRFSRFSRHVFWRPFQMSKKHKLLLASIPSSCYTVRTKFTFASSACTISSQRFWSPSC